jgi:hypothetical protein
VQRRSGESICRHDCPMSVRSRRAQLWLRSIRGGGWSSFERLNREITPFDRLYPRAC